jgi:phosphoglycolate phosphatase
MFLDDRIEVLRPGLPRGRFRAALFDFDGTLSLLREGWPEIMVGMMVEELRAGGVTEPDATLHPFVDELVMRLNGRPTIVQMERFAEELSARGCKPADPAVYKDRYTDRLMSVVEGRIAQITDGRAAPQEWVVPGSHDILEALKRRGMALYLASGTDIEYVRREAELLGVAPYFGGHIYAASDGDPSFSKRRVIESACRDLGLAEGELLGFGDGMVETEEVRSAGGVAVAVASQPFGVSGVHAGKRERLIRAGADVVIPEYRSHERLLEWLFAKG